MSAIVWPFSSRRRQVREIRRRLDVEHRGQGVVLDRHVLLEPGDFLARRAAPVDEVIGAARHAGRLGARPVGGESLVGVIAALGRLDPGESDAAGGHRAPVDIPLIFRDVDAVDRVVAGLRVTLVEIERANPGAAAGEAERQREER